MPLFVSIHISLENALKRIADFDIKNDITIFAVLNRKRIKSESLLKP